MAYLTVNMSVFRGSSYF